MSKVGAAPRSEFLDAMREAADIMVGRRAPARAWHPPATVDVRAIRTKLGVTQAEFAQRYGFGLSTVRDWEQGRTQPDQAARSYLTVIDREPETVGRVLEGAMGG